MSAWIDLAGPAGLGRLIGWDDGAVALSVVGIDSGEILTQEHRTVRTDQEVADAAESLVRWVRACGDCEDLETVIDVASRGGRGVAAGVRDLVGVEECVLRGLRDSSAAADAIRWEPEWDEFRGIAVKAVWALAWIGSPAALAALRDAARHEDENISRWARSKLARFP